MVIMRLPDEIDMVENRSHHFIGQLMSLFSNHSVTKQQRVAVTALSIPLHLYSAQLPLIH